MGRVDDTIRLIEAQAAKEDAAILMCSLGKDSLVALDLCYPRYKRLVCVFMYFVKGLEHIERYVRWVKARYPRAEFVQIPHWNLSYVLRSGMYCVARPKTRAIRLTDVVKTLRIKYQINTVILGMKKADGMNRRLMLNTYQDEGYCHKGMFYPLAEWNQREVMAYMRVRSIPEPVRYSLKASGGVGFNEECLSWLERNCPGDLEKIYKVFPLCERVLWERHQREAEKDNNDNND
ncbi:MAG: phosphoadenosine phosphosulfate reductase family protein [Bacteroidales bacterium]|nr:phosphoadenosine phosphosulfate reductase family protein [Bacteroidales bacterium]